MSDLHMFIILATEQVGGRVLERHEYMCNSDIKKSRTEHLEPGQPQTLLYLCKSQPCSVLMLLQNL